jgi:hypothetical protein
MLLKEIMQRDAFRRNPKWSACNPGISYASATLL